MHILTTRIDNFSNIIYIHIKKSSFQYTDVSLHHIDNRLVISSIYDWIILIIFHKNAWFIKRTYSCCSMYCSILSSISYTHILSTLQCTNINNYWHYNLLIYFLLDEKSSYNIKNSIVLKIFTVYLKYFTLHGNQKMCK